MDMATCLLLDQTLKLWVIFHAVMKGAPKSASNLSLSGGGKENRIKPPLLTLLHRPPPNRRTLKEGERRPHRRTLTWLQRGRQ